MGTLLLRNVVRDGVSCDIYIKEGVVSSIGRGLAVDADTVLDGGGKTVMPAFVNMHTHSGMTLFRGICEDMPLSRWLDAVWKAETVLDDEFVYWATRLACLEMIKTGTAAFNDMYWRVDKAARAVEDRSPRVRFGVSIHAHYTVCDENMLWAADFARSRSLLLHTHISETRGENEAHLARYEAHLARYGVSPTRRLADMGLLGRDVVAAHTLWLNEEDVRLLGKSGTTVVHNINSNLKLASGYRFLYNELRDAGANVTMGTDGCGSSNNLDMREALKTAALMQKAWRDDPAALPVDELLAMGTVNGAKGLRLNSGAVEEGRLADLILVDTDSAFFIPEHNFKANLIYAANSSCIDTLICDGRVLMSGGKVDGEKEVLARAREEAGRFIRKINSI